MVYSDTAEMLNSIEYKDARGDALCGKVPYSSAMPFDNLREYAIGTLVLLALSILISGRGRRSSALLISLSILNIRPASNEYATTSSVLLGIGTGLWLMRGIYLVLIMKMDP